MAYATKEQKKQAAREAYAKAKGITLPSSSATQKTYATKEQKKQAAREAYKAQQANQAAYEANKTYKQTQLSQDARERRDEDRTFELPRVEPEAKPTYNEEQKKLSFKYSSILQQQKQTPVTDEDRKFFKLNTAPTKINSFIGMTATDDDIRVAKYYYEKATAKNATKEDKEQWKDIRNFITNKDAQRYGEAVADTVAKNDEGEPTLLAKVNAALNTGIAEGLATPVRAVGTYLGNDRLVDNAFAVSKYMDMGDQGKVEQLALSAVESIGRMVPSQLIGMATHPAVGSIIMGLGSAESAYEESLKEGATPGKAKVFGALVGAAEAALGYFLGGIPGIKQGSGKILDVASEGVEGIAKSTLKKIAPKALSSIDNVMAKIIKNPALRQGIENYIGNIGSEAVEESLQSVFESGLKKWLLGQEDTKLLSTETLESGLLGGVIAAVLGIPGIAIDTTNAANAPTVTAPETNVETDTTTEAETETAKPKITEADLQAALDDAAKVKASSRGTAAAKRIYTDGEVTAKEIQHIMSSPEGRAALELYFDTKLDSQTKASDVRKTIRAVAEQRKAQLASDPAAKLVADVEAGRITAAEILADEANIEALQAEYDRLEAKVKAAEEADPSKGGMYRVTADGHKVLNIGLQFFANKPKTATARPANAPRQAPQEAQADAEAPNQATTPPEAKTPSTSSTEAAQPTNEAYQRPEGTRKFGETVINSKYISESSANVLKEAYADKRTFAYEKGTNADQIKTAEEKWNVITDEGKNMAAAVGELNRIFESGDRLSAADGAFAVYAINRANAANDLDGLVQLAEKIAFLATESGQFIQTLSMISKLSPQGQLIANQRLAKKYEKRIKAANEGKKQTLKDKKETERKLEQTKKKLAEVTSELDRLTEELNAKNEALKAETKRTEEYYKTIQEYIKKNRNLRKLVEKEIELQAEINKLQGKVELSDYTQFLLASAKTTAEMNEARNAALKEIALQTPITYIDVIEWLRYGAMLSGPLSNMRNMASNAINFAVAQTVVVGSTVVEKTIPQDRRVSSVINPFSAKDKALLAAAKSTYAEVETELKTGDKVERASAVIARNRTTGNKALDFALRDFWSKPLDWGDTPFLFSSYVLSYAQACKARGLDPNTATEAQLEDVKAYAISAAQQATFRRTSETASWLSRLERQGRAAMTNPDAPLSKRIGGGLVYTAIGGLAPFKSVPANILKQGAVDYTPLGIADGIRTAYKTGKVDGQAIQKMCKGMTGTMIMGLGALLSSLGLLHANDDEKEAQYLKSLGQRNYSIDIGNLNISGTWVGPVAIPLFMGATINEICADGFEFDEILNIIASVVQPVVDTTVLSGVNDYITTIEYNGIQGAVTDPFATYFGSFSPALLNAINKTFIDPKRRTSVTTASSGGAESVVKYAVNNYMSRTPGLSYELPVYVDCWGREEDTGDLAQRFANNFLNFSSAKEMNISDVDREIIRLYGYETDGVTLTRNEVLPPMDNVKVLTGDLRDGSDFAKELTTDEIIEYRKTRGTTAYDTLEALFKTKQYSGLPDDTKALAIDMAYTYASAEAKAAVADVDMRNLVQDTWLIKAHGGFGDLSVEEVILCRAVTKGINGQGDISNALEVKGLGKLADKYWYYYKSSSSKEEYQAYLDSSKSKKKEGE